MQNINQVVSFRISLLISVLFIFMSFTMASAQTDVEPEFDCGAEYDPSIALNISAEYKEALKARDYDRLKELKIKRENIDLWEKNYSRNCSESGGVAETEVETAQDIEAVTEVDQPQMCAADVASGQACDDGLFCTSADGKVPGPDVCVGGKCSGIAIAPVPDNWS